MTGGLQVEGWGRFICGYSSMVEHLPSKQATRVRFPLPAPTLSKKDSGRMKLMIDREALKRKILEDDYDGDVEAGYPVTPEILSDIVKRHMAASETEVETAAPEKG